MLPPPRDPLSAHTDRDAAHLRLPEPGQGAWEDAVRFAGAPPRTAEPDRGPVVVHAGGQRLGITDLRTLVRLLAERGRSLVALETDNPQTLVAARALHLPVRRRPRAGENGGDLPGGPQADAPELLVHVGTLRSGDHLEAPASVLVVGDVNPGAVIRAGRHILVWGRLRGIAHAGTSGDGEARIAALQLRPLQLRIGDLVARGPEEAPPPGLAEQAAVVAGEIHIAPARTGGWP